MTTDRGEALTLMTKAVAVFIRKLYENIRFDGIIGAGKYPVISSGSLISSPQKEARVAPLW